jgi:hypothetical protein
MKRIVLFPFLFALYLITNLVTANLNQLNPALAWTPLLVMIASTAVGVTLFALILKNWHYGGYLFFLVLVFFFSFGHISRVIGGWFPQTRETLRLVFLGIWWLLLGLLGLKKVWERLGGAERVTSFLNLVFLLAIAVQTLTGIISWAKTSFQRNELTDSAVPGQEIQADISLDCQNRPDIYYIIVDGYARQDVLQEIYDIDNAPFLQSLEEQGFYIASQAHSNYSQTVYSLSSSLNMNYLGQMPAGESPEKYFSNMITNNRVMEILKKCDYQTVAIETGFFYTNRIRVDTYLTQAPRLNEFTAMLFAGSPIDVLAQALYSRESATTVGYEAHRNWILFNFKSLAEIPDMPGPKFVFAHILAPHPPFVFDSSWGAIDPNRDYQIMDGSAFAGDWNEYRAGYSAQVQFVDTELAKTIDAILTRSLTPPIIIIQGDHGPGSLLDWENVEATCLFERTSILNAYYLPGDGVDLLYPEITPVNTFRLILKHYLGADIELLPNRVFFSSFVHQPPIVDVNDRANSRDNCTPPPEK